MVILDISISRYLNRINYKGSRVPNLKVLKELQRLHLLHVPFENLDIHNDVPIELSVSQLFEKIVIHKRGGFCYELNTLFYELLIALGFEARLISGRPYDNKTKTYRKKFSHLAIIVCIEGMEYLVDVGFGEFSFAPLKVEINNIQKDERGLFTIEPYNKEYLKVSRINKNQKRAVYLFNPEPQQLDDFWEMFISQQTSPDSPFTQKRLISLATEDGRVTVSGNTLITSSFGRLKTSEIRNETDFNELLDVLFYRKGKFGLNQLN